MNSSQGPKFILKMKKNGLLYVQVENHEYEVYVKPCFPWSRPQEFLSLRDRDDNEVVLIQNLNDLDAESRGHLLQILKELAFVLVIEKVFNVEEDVELRNFHVLTTQGERVFQTKLDDWPEKRHDGSLLLVDIGGDHFQISSFEELDEQSQKKLAPYVA